MGKFSYTYLSKLEKKKPIKVNIKPKHLKVVRNGLSKVVESGTGVSINHGYETKISLLSQEKLARLKIVRVDLIMHGSYVLPPQKIVKYL